MGKFFFVSVDGKLNERSLIRMSSLAPAPFNTTYHKTIEQTTNDDIAFGAKQIVVLCTSALIVIVLILVGRYCCIQHRQQQIKESANKQGQTKEPTLEMGQLPSSPASFDTVQSESTIHIPSPQPMNSCKIGQHVKLNNGKQGRIRYIGPTTFSDDMLYGIELDKA